MPCARARRTRTMPPHAATRNHLGFELPAEGYVAQRLHQLGFGDCFGQPPEMFADIEVGGRRAETRSIKLLHHIPHKRIARGQQWHRFGVGGLGEVVAALLEIQASEGFLVYGFVINSDNSWYFYNTATRNAGRTWLPDAAVSR